MGLGALKRINEPLDPLLASYTANELEGQQKVPPLARTRWTAGWAGCGSGAEKGLEF